MSNFSLDVEEAIAEARKDVAGLHAELVRYGLVVWTGGNISGRVPGADLFVIKPSGVEYEDITPDNMILCDLDGNVIPGTPGAERSPSSDTAAHAYVYRNMPVVGGVVHTHSTYATAWAARGEEIVITRRGEQVARLMPPRAPDALGQARTLAARIRNTRMGHGLGGGVSIREMIEEGRR